METPFYQVDAFASRLFTGNPAAVCPLQSWLPDATLQAIAAEHNLSETAFFVWEPTGYRLRWFTPACEVDLCGHATLAAAYVLFCELGVTGDRLEFATASGTVAVTREGELLALDFPSRPPHPIDPPRTLAATLGATPAQIAASRDYFCVYQTEAEVRALTPDFPRMAKELDRMVIVTAPGDEVDFVSRFFAPGEGIDEDPVTGSAHCSLIPYWADRLGKSSLHAKQLSRRGGELWCSLRDDRVRIAGGAVLFARGSLLLP